MSISRSMVLLDRTSVGGMFVTFSNDVVIEAGQGTAIVIPVETFEELKQPEQLTVTIQSGDRLNGSGEIVGVVAAEPESSDQLVIPDADAEPGGHYQTWAWVAVYRATGALR